MKMLRALCLAAAVTVAGAEAASAGPMNVAPAASLAAEAGPAVEKVVLVCGPYRCFRRPGWRYGWRGYGYRRWGWRRYGWRRW